MIATIQWLLFLAVASVALVLEMWALLDAARREPAAFTWAAKRTKVFWLLLLAVGAVFGTLGVLGFLGGSTLPIFLLILAVVPAAIYLADVRPAVSHYRGPRPPTSGRW